MDDSERLVVLLEARIRDFERNMQKASGTAGREFGSMRQEANRASRQMEADMVRSTSRINQALATVSARAGAMASAFAPIGAGVGIAGAAIVGLAAQARQTAREIATIGDEAKRAGIGVRAFQELKFVADQNRVSIDALTDGIKEMNLRADEFIVTGSGSGAEAFKRLGLTATDLAKKLKDPSALFTEIIGKMEQMDRAAQIRVADEVFGGTGGEQFVQLIEQGAAGIRSTISEANRLGIVMDEEMIAKAAEVDRQFGIVTGTVGTKLKGAIVSATGALAEFLNQFNGFEQQQTSSLQLNLADIFEQRQAVIDRIAEMQKQDAEGWSPFKNTNEIKLAQVELEKLTAEAGRLKDILDQRAGWPGPDAADTANTEAAADAGTKLGDALGYVERNGGGATAATDAYGKSVADLRTRLTDTVAGLQLTINHFGKSEGAIAAARFEAEAMADALRTAKAAGKDAVDEKLAGFIRQQAADYGRLTDRIAASTKAEEDRQKVADRAKERSDRISSFEADLAFERSIFNLPDAEQKIRTTLRDLDVDFASFEGQRLAGAMRYNEVNRAQQDALRKTGSIAEEMGDIFADVFASATRDGEDFFGSIVRSLAGLGSQLAAAGAKNLFSQLFGLPQDRNAAGIGGLIGQSRQGSTAGQNYTAPLSRVEQSVLPSISRTSTRFAASSTDLAENIRLSADTLGVAARDIATVISFETGGTFDPWKAGPTTKWGQHRGLIQWGEPQAARYGVTQLSSIADQMKSVTKYLYDAGVRPGHGLLDIYSAVNAGRVGRYNASDTAAGGTWGTVRDKVNHQMSAHVTKADALLGATTRDFQRATATGVSDGLDRWLGDDRGSLRQVGSVVGPSEGPTRGQALAGGLFGLAGIAAQGYSSGSPLSGGLSGAMGGFQLGGSIASAFPSLAGIAGPAGMAIGAVAGCKGGKIGKFQRRIA